MSGHSKWSTIKRQKGVADARRGNLFTKLANSIAIAARDGGSGDPNFNFRLRLAMEKGRQANMPKDNIQRAIDKGLGKGEGGSLQTAIFEGFGPTGVAVIVEAITDNTTRTGSELRNFFEKHGGSLVGPGSVAYMFEKVGEIDINKASRANKDNKSVTYEEVFSSAIEAQARDVEEIEGGFAVYTAVEDLHKTKEALEKSGLLVESAEISYRPNKETMISVAEPGKMESVRSFLEELADLDDVQNVFANINI